MSETEEIRTNQTEINNGDKQKDPEEEFYINPVDGLTTDHPILPYQIDSDEETQANDTSNLAPSILKKRAKDSETILDDLPASLIVTNIHSEVFTDEKQRAELEELFKFFSPSAEFQWFRSFRRLRVNFDSAMAAATARIQLQDYKCGKSRICCFFAQPVTPVTTTTTYLQPPAPYKQFLISPPVSPPMDWRPHEENEPIINQDLLAALANLTPGESHELHPQSTEHPAIVVHTAFITTDDDDTLVEEISTPNGIPPLQQRILQTRCPERTWMSGKYWCGILFYVWLCVFWWVLYDFWVMLQLKEREAMFSIEEL